MARILVQINDAIELARLELLKSGIATEADIIGCSEVEIASLEQQQGVVLPSAYRFFLKTMGHKAGSFLQGTDWDYKYLKTLREDAEYLLSSSKSSFQLPSDAFVFTMHQGYSFLFFQTGDDDPPVMLYVEEEQPRQVAVHFSEWLRGAVKDEILVERTIAEIKAHGGVNNSAADVTAN